MNEEQAAKALKSFGSDLLATLGGGVKGLHAIARAIDKLADNVQVLAEATAGEEIEEAQAPHLGWDPSQGINGRGAP